MARAPNATPTMAPGGRLLERSPAVAAPAVASIGRPVCSVELDVVYVIKLKLAFEEDVRSDGTGSTPEAISEVRELGACTKVETTELWLVRGGGGGGGGGGVVSWFSVGGGSGGGGGGGGGVGVFVGVVDVGVSE